MKKAKEELIDKISVLNKYLIKNHEVKFFSDQREKLNFLIRFINDNVIVKEEISIIKPFRQISIDGILVSRYIDEITFLLRDNGNEIILSNAEKVNAKNLIQLIGKRTMTEEEETKKLAEINKIKNLNNQIKLELNKRIEAANEESEPDKNQIELLSKCIKFIELRKKLKNNPTASVKNEWNEFPNDDDAERVLFLCVEIKKEIENDIR